MDWWWRRKRNKKQILARGAKLLEDLIECCDGKSNPIKFFSADQILKLTNSFNYSNHISGLTGYGCYHWTKWYSGNNENHRKILVKKLCIYQDENICRDIAISSMVSGHKSFLKLFGYCFESECPVMVYHGVKNHGKLDISAQTWKMRIKTSYDIATALAYLHTAFPRPFVYRSMSLGNIFVDEYGNAKLTDLSYCVSIPQGETFVCVDDTPVGFYGYIVDHNYRKSSIISEKTDVFSFGFLMQSLLVGSERSSKIWVEASEKGYTKRNVNDDTYQFWLSKFGVEDRRMDEIADPHMIEKMNDISEQELFQMKAFLMFSLRCVGLKGEIPTMVEVAKELKNIQRFLYTTDSFSSSGETQFNFLQDISSIVDLSSHTTNTKAFLTCIACLHIFHEMFQWLMLTWFRFLRKKKRMC
ncbi:hypothetical protein CARUB_v10022174mg [Capsella rubella]|uniref:Protein kinase domain-containing protein n=2 Tax=Capsella rubella TaxID=81985 RepID=R0GFK4_9BRAS|nr:hypothetical protein CARUB_v10022174mg [Capsella rubella]